MHRPHPQPLQPGDALGGQSGGERRPWLPSLFQAQPTCARCPGRSSPSPQPGHPRRGGHPTPLQQGAPSSAQLPLTHTELLTAPCGCCFDPRGPSAPFNITGSDVPPSPTADPYSQGPGDMTDNLVVTEEMLQQEALRLFGHSLDAVGVSQHSPSSSPTPGDSGVTREEGGAMAPGSPVLPMSIPTYKDVQGQLGTNISSTATPTRPAPGSNIPPSSDVPTSPDAVPHNEDLGGTPEDLDLSDEMLLEEALSLFGWSLDSVGISQDGQSSSPTPGDPGDTGAAIPPCDSPSLELPDELLCLDFTIPDTIDSVLGLEDFLMGLEAQEPWGDVGMESPPSRPAVLEKWGWKRGQSTLSPPPNKSRAVTASPGGPGGTRE
uniref:Uncharacterized protein n=1 Tax=Strix occidentalis caurina TaxID=311401 RepID=A0A8D0FBM0_STROC